MDTEMKKVYMFRMVGTISLLYSLQIMIFFTQLIKMKPICTHVNTRPSPVLGFWRLSSCSYTNRHKIVPERPS